MNITAYCLVLLFFEACTTKSSYRENIAYTRLLKNDFLCQFCGISLRVANCAVRFQRTIDRITQDENPADTFAYIDNITQCWMNKEDHDKKLSNFLSVVKKYRLTLNGEKNISGVNEWKLVDYEFSRIDGTVYKRLLPLWQPSPSKDLKSKCRTIDLHPYYFDYISHFSDKICPMVHNCSLVFRKNVKASSKALKN